MRKVETENLLSKKDIKEDYIREKQETKIIFDEMRDLFQIEKNFQFNELMDFQLQKFTKMKIVEYFMQMIQKQQKQIMDLQNSIENYTVENHLQILVDKKKLEEENQFLKKQLEIDKNQRLQKEEILVELVEIKNENQILQSQKMELEKLIQTLKVNFQQTTKIQEKVEDQQLNRIKKELMDIQKIQNHLNSQGRQTGDILERFIEKQTGWEISMSKEEVIFKNKEEFFSIDKNLEMSSNSQKKRELLIKQLFQLLI